MALIGIYGAGGCGRGVMPLARQAYGHNHKLLFVDDQLSGESINGHQTLSFDEFAALEDDDKAISLAIANGKIREKLDKKSGDAGIAFTDIHAAQMVHMDAADVGVGSIFSPFTTLTSNIRIGRHFHCNLYSYVEHDCIIGDFVTFAPAVRCNGNVRIGDRAYIGSNAVIKQGVIVGEDAVIGMGAVVTKDVGRGQTVVGNPARPLDPK
ncbi:MAG: acetyltransferase [Sphingorhabdus sp.]